MKTVLKRLELSSHNKVAGHQTSIISDLQAYVQWLEEDQTIEDLDTMSSEDFVQGFILWQQTRKAA